jgi:flagellar M-ring protein FliF
VNLDQLLAHFKKLGASLTGGQIAGLVAVFVAAVAIVVGSAYWISQPSYTLLVADMDAETASSVVSKLKEQKVAYQLGDGGRSVSVPVERADELRLSLASDGLPSAGRIGFEIFDRPAFGTTEFLEHVNYRRALEGELARTIATLAEVSSARVHIAMAKDSLFVDQQEPAKASVVLKLKANRPLPSGTVKGIANLVAGSVESLRPEAVVILDNYGRPLTRADDEDPGGAADLDRQQTIERDMTTRVTQLLEPVVGAGRVRVNVAAVFNPQAVDETEERWDPTTVVRSRQTSTETSAAGFATGGIAGARANQPPPLATASAKPAASGPASAGAAGAATTAPTAPAAATGAPTQLLASAPVPPALPGRTSETTNYEVGKITRHTVTPEGQLARLSVAVILDDERVTTKAADGTAQTTTRPWDTQGIQRISGLVSAAVGINPQRGDLLTVENIAFDSTPTDPDPAPVPMSKQVLDVGRRYGPETLRGLAILLLAIAALFGVLRPLTRRALTVAGAPALPAPAAAAARLPTIQEMEGQIDAELEHASGARRLPVLTKRVAKLANDEPEQLARIVRGWMAEEER